MKPPRCRAIFLLACLCATAGQAQNPPPAPSCTGPEHRQFDFWVGHWDVYPTGKGNLMATSFIEKLYAGCTVRENWMPLKGTGGGSLNMYDPADGRWHQIWHDSSNSRAEFDGGLVDGKMVMLGFWKGMNGPGKDALLRMTYSRNGDGSVRQFGEASTDHGLTWQTSFDLTYMPHTTRRAT